MSTLRVANITNTSGTNAIDLTGIDVFNTGVLQSVQVTDSNTMNFAGSWTQLGALSINFTPRSTRSKILITTNTNATNIVTNDWSLYTLRLRVGDAYPYYRYVGTHYHQAYVPVEITFQIDSWGLDTRFIGIEGAAHANQNHQLNRKVWDPSAGAYNNTSLIRVTEFQTL